MKLKGETNCLVFDEFTPDERASYFEKFGEAYWNADEDIVCYPTKEINNESSKSKFETFFGVDITKAQFLIIQF